MAIPASSSLASEQQHKVLLLIDVQINMLAEPGCVPAAKFVRRHIELILEHARTSSTHPSIIHIRNNGDPGDPDQPGTAGWHLALPTLLDEPIIDKFENNAFAGTKLGDLVPATAEIVVVGMQSEFCIRATSLAALERGNKVLLVEGAHATYDQTEDLPVGETMIPASKIEKGIESELQKAGVSLIPMSAIHTLFTD